ncbi:MAG TPA: WYL domain-containing protein [Kribbella sp.]|nr:WYL domain-containing protein [Kribbella sp.]
MRETSSRLLALLALMQSRPAWPGSELAERLEVSTRTIRNDIDRLRELGYPVDAVRGSSGYYQLGVGAKLPPLLLDDEEAVAVAIGLRTGTGVSGIEESSARALAKLEQVLPHRLRRQVTAIHSATSKGPDNTGSNVPDPIVDPTVLTALATAIRDHHQVRFSYDVPDPSAAPTEPGFPLVVEPYRLVSWVRHWYLVGRDPQSGDWRSYRVDWIDLRMPTGRRFTPQPLPGEDYTSFVLRDVATTGWKVHARITVFAPAEEVLSRIHAAVGVVESVDESTSVLVTGADSLEVIAVYIGMLGLDFRVTEPPGLVDHLRVLGERYAKAVT